MRNKTNVFALGILLAGMAVYAQTYSISYGPSIDRAGPVFGMSVTINAGTDASEEMDDQAVVLKEMSFRNSDSGSNGGSSIAYLQIYDAFATNDEYIPTSIGNLVAVSDNSIDLSQVPLNAKLTWHFADTELDPSKEYHYILSTSTRAATVADNTNLTTSAFRLDTGNLYPGGRVWRSKSNVPGQSTDWDMEFEAVWAPKPIPEPILESVPSQKPMQTLSPFIVVGGIGLFLIRARFKH